MKKILLIGIGGVYNYGCEAIVRGSVEILRQCFPFIEITYVSYNYEYDADRLKDLNIKILNRKHSNKRWTVKNIYKKILSYVGLKYNIYESPSITDGYDAVFSIGGDIYTLDYKGGYNYSLPYFIDKSIKRNPTLKYILWGASVGPFSKNKKAEKYFKKHLSRAHLIVAREEVTRNYLEALGIKDNVVFAPDPAFFVPFENSTSHKNTKITIGINLSPLSALYTYGDIEKAIEIQKNTIEDIVNLHNVDVVLIPHVIAPNNTDNDLWFLNRIYQSISNVNKDRIKLIDTDDGFIGRKEILKDLDYMIAARMHCAINAISCGVPTLFLSYSAKAKGMSKYIYGDESQCQPLEVFENPNAIIKLFRNKKTPRNICSIQDFSFKEILG